MRGSRRFAILSLCAALLATPVSWTIQLLVNAAHVRRLAIVGVFVAPAVGACAVVFGVMALRRRASPGGMAMAILGIATGLVVIAIHVFVFSFLRGPLAGE
jgi:fucose 4-O-acetylase-like acetyltransferase